MSCYQAKYMSPKFTDPKSIPYYGAKASRQLERKPITYVDKANPQQKHKFNQVPKLITILRRDRLAFYKLGIWI